MLDESTFLIIKIYLTVFLISLVLAVTASILKKFNLNNFHFWLRVSDGCWAFFISVLVFGILILLFFLVDHKN